MVAVLEESTVIVNEGVVAQIMVNRPQHLNALNIDVLQGLALAFERLNKNSSVRVVTLWGAGDKAFAAGIDVHGIAGLGKRPLAEYVDLGQRALRAIETFRAPVIAAVHGYAFGAGLELALACDIIIAASEAKLGLPESGLGIIPAFGGMQRIVQRCGAGAARRLALTGELIEAQEAYSLGLVDKIAAPGKLTEEVNAMADMVCKQAPLAVAKAKQVLLAAQEQAVLAGMRRECEGCLELWESADREEGLGAFMQKRPPVFGGR
jgi:enoyl-CoA hydratase